MIGFFLWVFLVSFFTVFGALYAKRFGRADALVGLYVAFVLFSNIAAVKIAVFDFGFAQFFAPAVVVVFSVTFLLTDIVNEKFGRKEAQKMILIAFISQIAVTVFSFLVLSLQPAPFWVEGQKALESVFGLVPRIIFASWIAFLVSENLDAYVFEWLKRKTNSRHLWVRNAFSSIPAMLVDSALFVSIAFFGLQPVIPLIIGQTVLKWLVAVSNIPFMYLNRWIMFEK
ncbi:MAG: queuosine precursor transporter [Candidatus Diapherotrites archaeon]|nr:queuosine precursor transporter [Candidatus Diapherotrites archaeon]